jgi:hypothetical protein
MAKLFWSVTVLLLVGLACTGRQTAPVKVTPATAVPVVVAPAAPSTPGVYYLWYKSQPATRVAVMGPSHKSAPVDGNQLASWFMAGTACVADAGTKAYRGSTSAPAFAVAIEVAEGTCRGFAGWVPMEAFQQSAR